MGVWYSVFVRSFADSNQDGIGDLQGLISKLDYLQDLGISGIWLLPIHPAPSYHKYDVTDYLNIDPEYGSLKDFDALISATHERGISVMMDMVFNHVSSEHPWFLEAQKGKENPYRKWFVWASPAQFTENEQYEWHLPETGPQDEYYYGLFWKGMPDLNFDHPPCS